MKSILKKEKVRLKKIVALSIPALIIVIFSSPLILLASGQTSGNSSFQPNSIQAQLTSQLQGTRIRESYNVFGHLDTSYLQFSIYRWHLHF